MVELTVMADELEIGDEIFGFTRAYDTEAETENFEYLVTGFRTTGWGGHVVEGRNLRNTWCGTLCQRKETGFRFHIRRKGDPLSEALSRAISNEVNEVVVCDGIRTHVRSQVINGRSTISLVVG